MMKVVPYDKKYKEEFIAMNLEWITKMFRLEPEDLSVLNHVDSTVEAGGQIYFAIDDEDKVLACCMIAPLSNRQWEIEKFCAKGMYTGTGAGSACFMACLEYAKKQYAERVVIVTNTKCKQAIHLYQKFGFTEMPVDRRLFPYERANISFEQVFTYNS